MTASRLLVLDPAGKLTYELDWSGDLPAGVSLVSVVHTLPAGLTKHGENTDVLGSKSSVQLSGIGHGDLFVVEAVATLSNGDQVPGSFSLRGFNG